MKREMTLRRTLIFFLALALVLPMSLFALASQLRIWQISGRYLDESVSRDIENRDTDLDLVLDKYSTLLYDFCTDDDVIALVENIDREDDELDVNSSNLRRRLLHICNRNTGVEGITLVTAENHVFFYDRMMASSLASSWAGVVGIPDTGRGPVFHGVPEPVYTEEGEIHLFQISRRLVDYRDVGRQIGTVVLSVNMDVLQTTVQTGPNSKVFLCEDGRIIAAADPDDIGSEISSVKRTDEKVSSVENGSSGWTLYSYYSLQTYLEAFRYQTFLWLAAVVIMVLFMVGIIWYTTGPLIHKTGELVQAMNQVQQGDFDVRIQDSGRIPTEVRKIIAGFNGMVDRIGMLIDRVRSSVEDQKNAELSAMEAQIDPHFLYNTLDTINWKALEKGEYDISNMVGALADILRYSIRNPGDTVSIGQELYWLEQYTMLQAAKLEQPLAVETDVPEEIKAYRIHKLLLQPFVENAIKHGMEENKEPGRLKIRMRLAGDQIHITIRDNGAGMSQEQAAQLNDETVEVPGHVGLANVRKRLKLYYGEDAKVFFESKEGSYTRVHLFVRAIRGEEENH